MEFMQASEVEQAYLKTGWYGDTGSGKSYTAFLIATHIGKTAYLTTERGGDFYIPIFAPSVARTTNLIEATDLVYKAVEDGNDCLIVDQISHFWESAQDTVIADEHEKMSKAWGVIEKSGNIPFQLWKKIKKPYKKFVRTLMDAPIHIFLLGRLAVEYEVGGDDIRKVGEKMNAEKDTPYEPHVLVKMEFQKPNKHVAWIQKDHSGTMQGKVFVNPQGDMLDPILEKLGKVQGQTPKIPEDNCETTTESELARESQKKIIYILAKKGGIEKDIVEKALITMRAVDAGEVINQLTLSNYKLLLAYAGKEEEEGKDVN